MTDPLHEDDPAQIGPYKLAGRLGVGGMGQVFVGRSRGGRLVAVKVVRPELAGDPDFRRRFTTEVEAARKVGGFYTAQVVSADPTGTPPWLATAYVPGPSLYQAVAEHGTLPVASVVSLGAGLAEGLAEVHGQGLVHRDLKPANVILAEDGPRLIDFGIARALDATSHTRTSTVLGTAAFMSPEQARADKVGPPSDVFSLGCVIAFAAAGRSPFGEGPAHAVAYRIVHEEPDLSGLPDPLEGLVSACLSKDSGARPDLDRILDELAALTPHGQAHTQDGWLPDSVTEAITQHRTRLLTKVAPSGTDTHRDGFRSDTQHPPERERAGRPETARPPTAQSLLVDERRQLRGPTLVNAVRGSRIASYWLLAALALFTLVCALTTANQFIVIADQGNSMSPVSWRNLHDASFSLWIVQIPFGAGLLVCWLVWFAQARMVSEGFAPGRLRYRPRMAVIGWFVPVVNLYLPKQIADDVWHASSPPGRDGGLAPTGPLNTWWILWLGTFLTWPLFWFPWNEFLDWQFPTSLSGRGYVDASNPLIWLNVALHVMVLPTAVVTMRYVRRLTAMQTARANG